MKPQSPSAGKFQRRWFLRYGLRGLFIITALIAIGLGVITNRAKNERRAVEAITELGGTFWYDYQKVPNQYSVLNDLAEECFDANAPIPGSPWLRNALGDEYFIHPIKVKIADQRIVDHGALAYLPDLSLLEAVMVYRVALREEDLAHFRLPRLRYAHFFHGTLAQIENADRFQFLASCTRLESIIVSGVSFRSEAMSYLRGLKHIRELVLNDTGIDDAGLSTVSGMTDLQVLELERTDIGDEGVAHCASLDSLLKLNLQGTQITDNGLRHVSRLRRLRWLILNDTRVTDAGVEHLTQLQELKRVDVHAAGVSQRGVEKWRLALPTCNVNP